MPARNCWTKKRFFLTLVFAAATFAASFVVGSGITIALGPGTSGVVTIVITTVLVVIGANMVNTRGYFTLAVTVFTLFAWPTSMFGPPGPHKIAIGAVTGLAYDLVWGIVGRKRWLSIPLAAAVSTAVSIVLIYFLLVFFFSEHPKLSTIKSLLKYLIPAYAVLGFLGGLLGNWIYRKHLAKAATVKMLEQ